MNRTRYARRRRRGRRRRVTFGNLLREGLGYPKQKEEGTAKDKKCEVRTEQQIVLRAEAKSIRNKGKLKGKPTGKVSNMIHRKYLPPPSHEFSATSCHMEIYSEELTT